MFELSMAEVSFMGGGGVGSLALVTIWRSFSWFVSFQNGLSSAGTLGFPDYGQVVSRDLQNGVETEGIDVFRDGYAFGGAAEAACAWNSD